MPSPFDHLAIPSAPYRRPLSVRLAAAEGPPGPSPEEQLEKILEKEKTQPLKPVEVAPAEIGHEAAAAAKQQLLWRIRAERPATEEVKKIVDRIWAKAVTIEPEVPAETSVKKEEGATYYQRLLDAERAKPVAQQNREMIAKWNGYIRDYDRKSILDKVPVPKPRVVETAPKSTRPMDPDDAAREQSHEPPGKVPPLREKPKPTPAQKPAPVEVVRPQGEMITFGTLLRDQVERVMQRVPGRAWLEILGPRMQAFYHRQFATRKAMQQAKAQAKLNLAREKTTHYADAIERSSGALRLVFGNRLRKWQKREELSKAKVNTLEIYRARRMERHNTFQQRVAERYEREVMPYQERIADLKKKKEAIVGAKKKLEQERANAAKLVTAAKTKPPGFFDVMGKANITRLERAVASIDRDIAKANKGIDAISAPLAKAEAKFQKLDSRRRIAVSMMEMPEQKDLAAQPL